MALQETGQGSCASITAAAAVADLDPSRRPVALGGTGCPKRSAAAGFPDDSLVDILSRLPAKPLVRCKCVSKGWCELISDRLRCRKLPQTLEGFFYGCVDGFSAISSEGRRDFTLASSSGSDSEDSDKSGSEDSEEGGGSYRGSRFANSDESGSENSDKTGREDSDESGIDAGDQGCSDDANEGTSLGSDDEGCSDDADEGSSLGRGEDGDVCGSTNENFPQHIHGNFVNLSGTTVPLVDPLFSSLRKQPGIRSLTLLDSCNGLLLFGHAHVLEFSSNTRYIVYNPATEHWVPVPNSGYNYGFVTWQSLDGHGNGNVRDPCVSTYLIFNPIASSHFQLIELIDRSLDIAPVYTYSSETGKWSNMTTEWGPWEKGVGCDFCITTEFKRGSTIFNKLLHLIVRSSSIGSELIAAINGNGVTCRVISWLGNRGFPIFVGQSKGLLHCMSVSGHHDSNSCHMTELSIWVLKDYDAEEWELKHAVSFFELFGKQSCQFGSDYNVATLHPEKNLIFFVQHWDYKLVSYDMDCKEVCALCTVGCDYGHITPYVPYFSETPVLSKKALSKGTM